MGLIEVLQIVFIVLKLTGVIDWSWWAVFIPLYVDIALYAVLTVYYIHMYIAATR